MPGQEWVVVGLDNGGNKNNGTVLDPSRRFLLDRLVETPSRVKEGPEVAVGALVDAFDGILKVTGVARARVRSVGLATPGPARYDGKRNPVERSPPERSYSATKSFLDEVAAAEDASTVTSSLTMPGPARKSGDSTRQPVRMTLSATPVGQARLKRRGPHRHGDSVGLMIRSAK